MTTEPFLARGRPLFSAPAARQLAESGDLQGAWKAQLASAHGLAGVGGDFAVSFTGDDGRRHLAVDRFAMQSICWRWQDGTLRFATDAGQLADPAAGLNLQALYDYLYFHVIPSPDTVWQGVHRLPAGHHLVDRGQAPQAEAYWTPTFEEPRDADFRRLAERFRQLMQQAVERQLDGTKPACFLSGGTDSSTVAGMVGQVAGRAAATYSIGFESEGYDEMAFARIAAKHFGTEHHEYYVTPDDLVRSIPEVAASYDQPFGNSSVLPAYYCARMARENGASRMLAGDGGDELFGGNLRYAKQRVFRVYDALPQGLRAGLIEPLALAGWTRGVPLVRKVNSYVSQARLGLPARLETYNLLERLGVREVLSADFLAAVDTAAPGRQQAAVWQQAVTSSPLNRHLAFDWRYTLGETDLPKVRGATALAGVTVGYPMLDADLVDFSLALPAAYKLKGVKLRWFFKEALRGFLPDEIITKRKQGFGLPFGPWAVRHAGLRALAADSLDTLAARRIVRREFVRELLDTHLPAHPGYYGEMVWILLMLEQWLRARAPRWTL